MVFAFIMSKILPWAKTERNCPLSVFYGEMLFNLPGAVLGNLTQDYPVYDYTG